MKFIKNFLVFLFFLLVGFGGLYSFLTSNPKIRTVSIKDIFSGSKFSLLEAPSYSIKANVSNLNGEVFWKSRISETATKVESLSNMQQGEGVITGDNGHIELGFVNVATVTVNENSEIDVVQTIPNDIVFSQKLGIIKYKKIGNIPVSVRVKRLLVEVFDDVQVEIDGSLVRIIGNAKIAYNNNANVTKTLNVPLGKTLIFNNQSLKVVVK